MTPNDIRSYLSFIYLFWRNVCSDLLSILYFSPLFDNELYNSFLYILDINLLSDTYFAEMFSCGLSFHFLS